MRESTAWRIVAEEYDAGRTPSTFLCLILDWPRNDAIETIRGTMRSTMISRIQDALGDRATAFNSDVGDTEGREARVLACLLFSAIAKDRVCL